MFLSTASCSSPRPCRRLRLPYGPVELPPRLVEKPWRAWRFGAVRSSGVRVMSVVALLHPEAARVDEPSGDPVHRPPGCPGDYRVAERLEPDDQFAPLATLHHDEHLLLEVGLVDSGPHEEPVAALTQAAGGFVEDHVAIAIGDDPLLETVDRFHVTLQQCVRHRGWPFRDREVRGVAAPVDESLIVERLALVSPLEGVLCLKNLGRSLAILLVDTHRQESQLACVRAV